MLSTYGDVAFALVCTMWLIRGVIDEVGAFRGWLRFRRIFKGQ
jgi:hypothetical protein